MSAITREDVSFRSAGESCAAWLYRPAEESGEVPCVVMAHGFSLTRHDGLEPFAERLAAAGAAVLCFDHRHLGDSAGEPRQSFRKGRQLTDWRNALTFAGTMPGIDRGRMVLWGYSFSGGHVVKLAAREPEVAAVVATCPFLNGFRRFTATRPAVSAWILPRALADLAGIEARIPVTGPPGSPAAMSFAGEEDGFARTATADSPWRNEISPGVFATIPFHRPLAFARQVRCPIWVGLGARDISVHGSSIELFCERAPDAELHRFDVDHFEPFTEPAAGEIATSQIEFLTRRGLLPGAASAAA